LLPLCLSAHRGDGLSLHRSGAQSFGRTWIVDLKAEARRYWEDYTGGNQFLTPGISRTEQEVKREARRRLQEARQQVTLRLCEEMGIPAPYFEFRFHPDRLWRWDLAWPEHRLAIEIDGGVWIQGKHGRGSGIVKDQEKRNAGVLLGWRYLVVLPREMNPAKPATIAATLELVRCVLLPEVSGLPGGPQTPRRSA